jgi:hypothetical protein
MSKNRVFNQEHNYNYFNDNTAPDMSEEHFSHKKDRANKRWEKLKRKKSRWDEEDHDYDS